MSYQDFEEFEDEEDIEEVEVEQPPLSDALINKFQEEQHEASYFIFLPKGKNMFTDYPELKEVEEFKKLSNDEMNFVWMVGNRSSSMFIDDFQNTSNFGKLKIAAEKAFGFNKKLDPEVMRKYTTGAFSIEVKMAIQKMNAYDPSVRVESKMMIEKIFSRWQNIVSKKVSDDKEYIDITSKIIDKIPDLIKLKENAFGVIAKKEAGKKENLMDQLLDLEQ